jgi:DNA-binding HxlR family transcriptional regulator
MRDTVKRKIRIEKTPGCVAGALCVVGDKWTPLIVMELAKGSSRFSLLEQALPGISPRTLSQRLDNLETEKIITKTSHPSVPPRVDYELTKKGKDLLPILRSMADWGSKYFS